MANKEIEVRFLEINKIDIIRKLTALNAENLGEKLLYEIIFYDNEEKWMEQNKYVRIRKYGDKIKLTYKSFSGTEIDSATEIELEISSLEDMKEILEKLGLKAFREQQKKRHTFIFEGITINIDTWPGIPTYIELEGNLERELKKLSNTLELKWENAVFKNAREIIEQKYNIPVSKLRYFTFDRIE